MILILEGCDCAGKSTLAEELARITGYEIVKGSSFEISQLGTDGMFEHMMGLLDRDNIIIDRFYMSNYVYGNKYSYPTMSDEQFSELAVKADFRALNVYVTASPHEIKRRMLSRGDEMIKIDEIDDILARYDEAFKNPNTASRFVLNLNTHLNTSKTNITALMIAEFAKNQETSMFVRDAN